MRAFVASLSTVAVGLCLCFFAADKLCVFHEAYEVRRAKIEKEMWLRDRCVDPVFFSHMGEYTSLCREVEATARIGAIWHAVNVVADSLPVHDAVLAVQNAGWPVLCVLAVVCLLFPSLAISSARAWHYHHQQRHEPYLPKYAA